MHFFSLTESPSKSSLFTIHLPGAAKMYSVIGKSVPTPLFPSTASKCQVKQRPHRIPLPLSDLIIAALAIERGCRIYSLDIHFKKIPGLHLYSPASA